MVSRVIIMIMLVTVVGQQAASQGVAVDSFQVESSRIRVLFFNPYFRFAQLYPNRNELTSRQKADLWSDLLRRSVIYMFIAEDTTMHHKSYYTLHGDPADTMGLSYYFEVLDRDDLMLVDPNSEDYHEYIVDRIPCPSARGDMFLHMFREEKRAAVTEAKVYGTWLFPGIIGRVSSYEQTKLCVSTIIAKHPQKK
jgi:hypothetical protein